MSDSGEKTDILRFEPETQLVFDKRNGEVPLTVTLRLSNTSSTEDVLFRIQTTSPAIYRVRPSHGRVATGSTLDVQVVMVTEPVKADKFLVKYVALAPETPTGEFMAHFEGNTSTAMERRLRVVLLGTDGVEAGLGGIASTTGSATGTGTGAGSVKEETPLSRGEMNSPHLDASAPVKRSDSFASQRSLGIATPASSTTGTGAGTTTNESAAHADLSTTASEGPMMVELKEARAKIQLLVAKNQELTKALEDAKNLRQRALDKESLQHPATKLDRGISESELNALISAQAGFPPVLVILIALFAFLVGLLF